MRENWKTIALHVLILIVFNVVLISGGRIVRANISPSLLEISVIIQWTLAFLGGAAIGRSLGLRL